MPDAGLYILTGPVQSGKTTSLIKWAAKKKIHGILTPIVNGKRMFIEANSNKQFAMEADADETTTLSVGSFIFSKKGFDKAAAVIRSAITKKGWLIIDEIGPLELRGEGFHDVVKEVLKKRTRKIILVVREGLVEELKKYFEITNAAVVKNIAISFPG